MFINTDISFGLTLSTVNIVSIVATILIVIIAGKIFSNKNYIQKETEKKGFNKKHLLFVFFIVIGYILIRNASFYDIISNFEGPISEDDIDFIMNNSSDIELFVTMIIFFLQVIIVAPIFEELFFRAIIFKGFINKYKDKPMKAIIWSSIIFGVVHLNIPQGINGFIAGVILACIYYYTKNIKLSIFAHFVNNFFVFIPAPTSIILKLIYILIGISLVKKGIEGLKTKKEKIAE